jgi:drug/metabolite transporter (DMT)-like permease
MRSRTYLLLLLFLALRAFGNLSLAWGTKRLPQALSIHPLSYLASMLDPFVAAGIAMLILALLARLALLSVADLSFVLPMTAVGYVFAAVLGRFFLHEQVTPLRWLAIFLIFAGAALVGSTSQSTTAGPSARAGQSGKEDAGRPE